MILSSSIKILPSRLRIERTLLRASIAGTAARLRRGSAEVSGSKRGSGKVVREVEICAAILCLWSLFDVDFIIAEELLLTTPVWRNAHTNTRILLKTGTKSTRRVLRREWMFFLAVLLAFQGVEASAQKESVEREFCAVARRAEKEVSTVRKLKFRRKVACAVHDENQVRDYLLKTITTKLPAGRLRAESLAYKTIGLIPAEFDYEKGVVNMYLGQMGGYYDPEKKHFIMASWMPAMVQMSIAVHELAHALEDQYWNLDSFVDMRSENGDVLLAHSALVEGSATAVALDYSRKAAGQPLLANDSQRAIMLGETGKEQTLGAAFSADGDTPASLQALLTFPYQAGFNFVAELLRRGGYGMVNKVYEKPPRSSEEVLHIAKYFDPVQDFVDITEQDVLRAGDMAGAFSVIYRETLGEIGIRALLYTQGQDEQPANRAAQGWGGDRLLLVSQGSHYLLIWKTVWDSEKDLHEFVESYLATLRRRYPLKQVDPSDLNWQKLDSKTEFRLKREGKSAALIYKFIK